MVRSPLRRCSPLGSPFSDVRRHGEVESSRTHSPLWLVWLAVFVVTLGTNAIAALMAPTARASALTGVTTTGCLSTFSCTLQELVSGGTIQVHGTLFTSWQIEVDPGTVDFTQVVVEGVPTGGIDPGPALLVHGNGQLAVAGPGEIDLRFGFLASTIDSDIPIHDNLLEVPSWSASGDASIAVDENVFDDSFRFLAWKDARIDPAFGELRTTDSAQFPLQTTIFVEKDLLIEGRTAGDAASIDEILQRFSHVAVPEPSFGASLLTGLGLLTALAGPRSRPGPHARLTRTRVDGETLPRSNRP